MALIAFPTRSLSRKSPTLNWDFTKCDTAVDSRITLSGAAPVLGDGLVVGTGQTASCTLSSIGFGASAWSALVLFAAGTGVTDATVLDLSDTTGDERIRLTLVDGSVVLETTSGGVQQGYIELGAPFAEGFTRCAFGLVNGALFAAAGGRVFADFGGSVPAVTTINFGSSKGGGNELAGPVGRFTYWPRLLTPQELFALAPASEEAVDLLSTLMNDTLPSEGYW